MIDNDENYYEVSNEDFARIQNTGEPIYNAPIYMQKVEQPATNPNFIQVGTMCYINNKKTKTFNVESKAIFMRHTKELEDGQRKMLDNFAKAIAPRIFEISGIRKQTEDCYDKLMLEPTSKKIKD